MPNAWSGKDLDAIAGDLQAAGALTVEQATNDAAEAMRRRVHVLTGQTKRSIMAMPTDNPLHGVITAGFGAVPEEFENDERFPRRAPHEFAQPALDEIAPDMLELLAELVKDALT